MLFLAAGAQPYSDSTAELSVGDSSFESWFSEYSPANKGTKQQMRDAYAAGMGDPLVVAAGAQQFGNELHFTTRQEQAKPVQREPLFWYRPCSDGGYEGPISNGSIEDVRKRSGAWIPLVAAPVQAGAQDQPTFRNPRTVESAQDHFAGAGKPIQERTPENCGTGHCSCISCVQVCQWAPDEIPLFLAAGAQDEELQKQLQKANFHHDKAPVASVAELKAMRGQP